MFILHEPITRNVHMKHIEILKAAKDGSLPDIAVAEIVGISAPAVKRIRTGERDCMFMTAQRIVDAETEINIAIRRHGGFRAKRKAAKTSN